jgi:hypothetical protein
MASHLETDKMLPMNLKFHALARKYKLYELSSCGLLPCNLRALLTLCRR